MHDGIVELQSKASVLVNCTQGYTDSRPTFSSLTSCQNIGFRNLLLVDLKWSVFNTVVPNSRLVTWLFSCIYVLSEVLVVNRVSFQMQKKKKFSTFQRTTIIKTAPSKSTSSMFECLWYVPNTLKTIASQFTQTPASLHRQQTKVKYNLVYYI